MSSYEFSNKQCIKVIETGEKVKIGGFKVSTSGQIKHCIVSAYLHKALTGSEQLRINVYSDDLYSSLLFSSDKLNLSDIVYDITKGWKGEIRFDFPRYNLNKNFYYYFELEPFAYTRNGDNAFIGISHEFLDPSLSLGSIPSNPQNNVIRMGIFKYD